MFKNIFKFISVAFLLTMVLVLQNSFSQSMNSESAITPEVTEKATQTVPSLSADELSRIKIPNLQVTSNPGDGVRAIYLTQDFETAFTGDPAAPPGWTQSRFVLVGDGTPEPNGTNGEKDWQQNIWTGTAWQIPGYTTGIKPTGAVSGTGVLFMEDGYFGGSTAGVGSRRLESPSVNLTTATSPYVRLWYFFNSSSAGLSVKIMGSSNGGATWNTIMHIPPNADVTAMTAATPWQLINVLIPSAYRTSNAKFGVEVYGLWGTNDIFIDDFVIEDFTPTTISSAQTGDWNNVATWVGGVIPTADNHVVIAAGHTVTNNVNICRMQNLTVEGTYTFSTTTTHLNHVFGNLTVTATGVYNSYNGVSGRRTMVGGNIVNDGSMTFSVGAGNIVWLGGSPATLSGAGTFVGGYTNNIWHLNSAGVTYNKAIEDRNVCGLYNGPVNPNGNLTLGFNTIIERTSKGSFASAPIWAAYALPRTVAYITANIQMPSKTTYSPGFEINTGVIDSVLTMSTYDNIQLTSPVTVGTSAKGGLNLTRGILITSDVNLLTLNSFIAGPAGTAPSTATPSSTHGSYIFGPMRINLPATGTTSRNFAMGVGTDFNGPTPTSNVLKTVALAPGATGWASQTLKVSIGSAPGGTTNPPLTFLMGPRSYRVDLLGGPDLPATATITIRGRNSTFGNSDNMFGDQSELRVAQSTSISGSWFERSLTSGTGAFVNNTDYSRTTVIAAPGPIAPLATYGEYFALATTATVINPSGVSATAVSPSQINVAFTPNLFNNNVVIVVNDSAVFTTPSGVPPSPGQPFAGGTLIYNGTTSPYNHTGLTSATTYYYKLFSYDGVGYSPGVTANATTLCEPITVFPWTEGFEAVTIPALPQCWFEDPSTGDWVTTNNANSTNDADARTGAQFLRESWSATNEYIWSPGFQLAAGVSYDFSFWWAGDNYAGWTGDVFYNILQSSVGATQIGTSFVTNGEVTTKTYQQEIYQFTPTVAGTYYFAIRVNCPTSTPWYLSFDDFSFQTTPTSPVFSISPTSKNFGSIYVGSSSANQTFTITNIGAGTLTITTGNISIVGTDASQFVLTDANTYPINLGNGQSAVVDVKFSPTTIGAKTADLQIIDNTADATHTAALTGTGATPPTVPDFEDFESFVVGQQVACQDPVNWTTWSNLPCNATEDAFISSTFAFSGTKSAKVVQNNDLVRLLNAQTSGKWHISFMSYIPTGKAGYFNTLALFVPVSGSIWGMECYFDVGGGGRVKAGSSAFTAFTWVPDSWKKVEVFVDLDVDSAKFLYDGALVISWKWTLGTGTTTPLQLDASDFFGATVNDEMYIDDYQIQLVSSNTFQLSVNVANGWNMVSIPGLHPTDQNVNTWWAFRDPGANVFRYAGGYQPITVAAPGIGYWMKHAGALTYNTGEEWPAGGIQTVAHDPLAGASGWNLIGGYELSVTAANVTTNPPGLQSGPIYAYSGGYQVATTLTPGLGYWIKLNAAGQIIIPESMAKGEVVEYFPEDWGRIILTDATGTSYTLYSVTGKVELSQYELPPAPPTGMFDIRYSSGRIAEDINSSVKTIDMSGVTYPLTVRVEGMDIRLMDETGKAINVNLKAGEDVVISDASVMKLMVSGELIPAQYSLEQNYPNPFNPSTVIEFSLPEDVGNVKLSIYNALGEKVAELVNTALTAGKYQYQWNAQNVATGMYIYELRTDNFVSVKKMVLLK